MPVHFLILSVLLLPAAAAAHGGASHASEPAYTPVAEEKPFGRPADPSRAKRTIAVGMSDAMRFTPDEIRVRRGETVRFVIRNRGRMLHEMVLGTALELKQHAELMRRFPDMEHDEPHMAHVPPGRTVVMGWQFTQPGTYLYGCLIPGHFEAGMVGRIIVE